jgi:hypothetical protein
MHILDDDIWLLICVLLNLWTSPPPSSLPHLSPLSYLHTFPSTAVSGRKQILVRGGGGVKEEVVRTSVYQVDHVNFSWPTSRYLDVCQKSASCRYSTMSVHALKSHKHENLWLLLVHCIQAFLQARPRAFQNFNILSYWVLMLKVLM